jgi:hypothetical protein
MTNPSTPAVTIQVFPKETSFTNRSWQDTQNARLSGATTVDHLGVKLQLLDPVTGEPSDPYFLITDLEAKLPGIFGTNDDQLEVNLISLQSPVPSDITAVHGWYDGTHIGFPGAGCCIDPEGKMGEPAVYCVGDSLEAVVGLFRAVLDREIQPTQHY